jgi:FKBP-type peptidyl-prolyl cis-trans isomerase 2
MAISRITNIFAACVLVLFVLTGCKKEEPLKVGDLVYTQYSQGEGNFWEPGKITAIEGEEVTVKWDDAFAKIDSIAKKHSSEVVKRERPDPKTLKVGSVIIIHPTIFLYPYKGKIAKIDGDRYIVDYKSGSVDRQDTVDIDALWKYR